MRSLLASVVLGLSFVAACSVGDSGTGPGPGPGGGDDVQPQPDAQVVTETPKLDVTIDKPTINTELGTNTQLTVTVTGSGGFSGLVNLTATAVDAADAPIPGWTVGLNMSSVTLAANGTATVVASLAVSTENRGLAGKVKISATSSAGNVDLVSDVTVANQVTINITSNAGGQCIYPSPTPMKVVAGTQVRFVNKFATDNIIIHSNASTAQGVPHENIASGGHAPNTSYTKTFGGTGTFDWYCHSPGPNLDQSNNGGQNNNPKFQIVQ